jgi:hypothetical protein
MSDELRDFKRLLARLWKFRIMVDDLLLSGNDRLLAVSHIMSLSHHECHWSARSES